MAPVYSVVSRLHPRLCRHRLHLLVQLRVTDRPTTAASEIRSITAIRERVVLSPYRLEEATSIIEDWLHCWLPSRPWFDSRDSFAEKIELGARLTRCIALKAALCKDRYCEGPLQSKGEAAARGVGREIVRGWQALLIDLPGSWQRPVTTAFAFTRKM